MFRQSGKSDISALSPLISILSCLYPLYTDVYIDEDKDGNYEIYDPDGGYTYQLTVGEYIKIELPLGNTVANYRLRFVNQTSTVTSGSFTITTSRN